MKKATTLIIFSMFFVLMSMAAVCANENATFDDALKVDDSINDTVADDSKIGTFNDLSDLINGNDDVIELNKDYKYSPTDTVAKDGIAINKPITINGNGRTIDASNSVRIFIVNSSNVILNNINFINGTASDGGAIRVNEFENFTVNRCNFSNNHADESGGAIISNADNTKITDCNFDNNQAGAYGGAVNLKECYYPTVKDTTFTSNKASNSGGAIYSDSDFDVYENVTFEDNEAYYLGGALALNGVHNPKVNDCHFDSNSADHLGGGIYSNSEGCGISNSTFVNGYAASGAGVYMSFDELHPDRDSHEYIKDSKFIGNNARYGGAGVTATSHAKISNSEFRDNSAGNYGGAVDLDHASLINSTLENNRAIYGGAIYIHDSDIINSTFRDNSAEVGNAIYILNSSNLKNNDVSDDDIFLYDDDFPGNVVGDVHDSDDLMQTDNGYWAYCSEKYALTPYSGVYDTSMEKLKNSINHKPIKDYLKILIYYYVDVFEDLDKYDFAKHVWEFTDGEYWNSNDAVVREVIRLYDSGLRVSTENGCKVLANGTLMYFNFSSMVTPSGEQNLFLFKFSQENVLNETLTKEALINKTVYLGDTVEYRIVINNKGASPVYGNWIEDKDYSAGLIYKTWRAEVGNWTYSEETGRWTLDVLEPGKSASIILTFGVTMEGLLYNNATSGLGVVNVSKSGDGFKAHTRNLTVEKRTITPQVNLSDLAIFEIVVRNTGDVDLDNVFVCESEYGSGLVYQDFTSRVGTWKHGVNGDGKHVFTLDGVLEMDESASFRVMFRTVKTGNFTNTVTAGFNNTTLSNSTNKTEVLEKKDQNTSENQTNNTTDDKINKTTSEGSKTDNASNSSEKKAADDKKKVVFKSGTDEKATGNPLLILILALMFLPLRRFKK